MYRPMPAPFRLLCRRKQ